MIDWIIRQLFKWESLRLGIFSEVDFYNSISRTFDDPEAMKIATAMWCESDGWRMWTIKDNGNYYFHDIPEKSIGDVFEIMMEKDDYTKEVLDRLGSDYDENGVPYWEKWDKN